MMNARLLRRYLREAIRLELPGSKKLRIFDFDDTIVRTNSLIHVSGPRGERFDLTPGEFAIYEPRPGDSFDFSDFSKLIDPQEIKWTLDILRRIVDKGGEVVILTARAASEPVHQFLEDVGLPRLEVVALGDGSPAKKAEYISSRLSAGGISLVEFFDDSHKNISAVGALQDKFPNVKIVTRHVAHRSRVS